MATKKVSAKKTAAPTTKATAKAAVPAAATKTSKAASATTGTAPARKLSKTETYRTVGEKLGIPAKQVASFFDTMMSTAIEQTKTAGEFTFPGLGKLVKVDRPERQGRNPATGESITIAAKTDVKFRVAKSIKDNIAPKK